MNRRAVRSDSPRKRRVARLTDRDYAYACEAANRLGMSFSLWIESLVANHRRTTNSTTNAAPAGGSP